MKLRINDNFIRLRLTRSEVETFGSKGKVEKSLNFGGLKDSEFRYLIEKNSAHTLHASFDGARIMVSVPEGIADKWVTSEDVGIEGADGDLRILIEKDFVCRHVRKGGDESDNYPDPKTAC